MKFLYEREYSAFIAHKTTLRFIVLETLDSGLILSILYLLLSFRANFAILVDFTRIKYMKHESMYSASVERKTIFVRVIDLEIFRLI